MAVQTIEMKAGEAAVISLALPGLACENAGVLLLDVSTGRLYSKFRRDWEAFAPDEADYLEELASQVEAEARVRGGAEYLRWLEDTLSHALRISDRERVAVGNFETALNRLYRRHVKARELPFRTHLPLYSCQAAAGRFGEHMEVEPEGWVEAPERLRLTEDMFVAQVVGHSMEPHIPDGSYCIFRFNPAGSRQNKWVLVEKFGEADLGGRYTVKRYRSEKTAGEDGWAHSKIILEPLNPAYEPWEISESDSASCRVIAEFVSLLE